MKKNFLAILLIVALVMSVACGTIIASADTVDAGDSADTAEATLVYVKLADSWTSANVHAYNESGDTCFGSWPGKALVADTDNDGWYYIFVSADMEFVIINATVLGETDDDEDTSVQTVSLAIEGDSWITIDSEPIADGDSAGNYDGAVATVQATTGELPVYVASMDIKVYAPDTWDSVSLWAWVVGVDNSSLYPNWPGEVMTLGSDGWYTMTDVPQTITGLVINNSVASDGMQTNNDVVIDTTKLGDSFIPTVYVHVYESGDEGKHTGDIYYNEMPDVTPKYTVHALIPSDWLMPCIWAWLDPAGTGMFASWPGGEMVLGDDGWYTYEVYEWVNSIIINGNVAGTTLQTVDLKEFPAGDIYIVVGEKNEDGKYEATVTSTMPTVDSGDSSTGDSSTGDSSTGDSSTDSGTTSTPSDTTEPTGLSTGAIIGIVAGSIVVVGAAVAAVIIIRKKKAN